MQTQPRPATSVRSAYRFFVPLMLMTELMMISHAVITAFLARMPNAEATLAAYSVSFYFYATLGSPVWAMQFVALSYAKDRASVKRLGAFSILVAASIVWIWAIVALTPVGNWFFEDLYGASAAVAAAAKLCTLVAFLMIPLGIARSIAYALIMLARRTLLITFGSVLRLVALVGILWALSARIEGAVVGALGLVGCIAVETVYAVFVARRFYGELPARLEAVPSYLKLWRFSLPIMLMHGMEHGVAFALNFFLGRLPRPELALAAFGVMDGLVRVVLGPIRNLVHTTQAMVRSRADMRVLVAFSGQLGLMFAGIMLLFNVDLLRRAVLEDVMGLPETMIAYVTPALAVSSLLAIAMAAASITRGLLIGSRNTGAIAAASVLRLMAVVIVAGLALSFGMENGATIGMAALVAAFGSEAVLLGARLARLDRLTPRLFEPESGA